MNRDIKARNLIAAGWHEGRRLGAALRRARQLEAEGLGRAGLLEKLEEEFPKQLIVALRRHEPVSLAEAIEADTAEEAENVEKVRASMQTLLHMPVISRGVIMPDSCPVGGGPGTIPVGGAIAVENVIIPGAHSADICCSMQATFFPANHPTKEIMDHLQKVTHFGWGGRPRGNQWTSPVLEEPVWDNPFLGGLRSRAQDCLGTQGDGNHFAYVGRINFEEAQRASLEAAGYTDLSKWIERRDGEFNVLVTHHGSRGLGADVYKRGLKAAVKWCRENAKDIPDAAAWLPADSSDGPLKMEWDTLRKPASG